MDANGYNPSILQQDMTVCYRCGRSSEKLDRHEVWGGSRRRKSKELGLWIMLCHDTCHLNGIHAHADEAEQLKAQAQAIAMTVYGWTTSEFIKAFGKNYL